MKDINRFTIKSTVFFIAKDSKHNSNNSNFYTTDFFSIVILYYKALLCINIYTWSLRNKYFSTQNPFPFIFMAHCNKSDLFSRRWPQSS